MKNQYRRNKEEAAERNAKIACAVRIPAEFASVSPEQHREAE